MLLWFITTTTSFPSSFLNAVVSNWLRLLLLMILLAPGFMNFEKCPEGRQDDVNQHPDRNRQGEINENVRNEKQPDTLQRLHISPPWRPVLRSLVLLFYGEERTLDVIIPDPELIIGPWARDFSRLDVKR